MRTNVLFESNPSLQAFLRGLESLLHNSGIAPSRQPVTAGISKKENRSGADPEVRPTVGRVIIYIEEHLTESLSLEKLAEEARLSKYQLIRRFRDEQGSTPWQFLIEKRIERAKELLEEGMSPGQVAVETGFYDQSHLHRKFREETGSTPKEYQEQNFKNRN